MKVPRREAGSQELKGEFRKITWLDKSSLARQSFAAVVSSVLWLYHSYRRLVDPDWFEFHSWVKDGGEYVRGRVQDGMLFIPTQDMKTK